MTFHKLVQKDISNALSYYGSYSDETADRFWRDLESALQKIKKHPTGHHYEASGLRRVNLNTYPYHVLYDTFAGEPRIWAVKHDKRRPVFGTKRFNRM